MEVLNPLRNRAKYGDDPLAPAAYPAETLFAIVMAASPLGWFEVQNLAPETVASWKPLVAKWKAERDAMAACNVIPIGARPDGVSWTGFLFEPRKKGAPGYMLLFRELNENAKFDLGNVVPAMKDVEVLAGDGSATPMSVTVNCKLGFIWLRGNGALSQ